MKILFIGCVESSARFLKSLTENNAEIVGVITKEKSSFNSDFVDLAPICLKYNIPYIYVDNVNEEKSVEFIKNTAADIGYCLGWSQLVKGEVIDLFPKGMIGYHPAELPNNRGRHPIIWALALGLSRTASTFFRLDKNADTGDILSQKIVDVTYEDDANSLMEKLLDEGAIQITELTKEIEAGKIISKAQEKEDGNSWRKRGRLDGQIDWRMSSRSIYNLVRSLSKPYVGAHFMYKNQEIKVWKVKEIVNDGEYENIEPGKVLDVKENSFVVKSGDNLVEVLDYDGHLDIHKGDYL